MTVVRIRVDRERCVGTGSCVMVEPAVFDQSDDDGRVVLHTDQPEAALVESVRAGVAACPVKALTLDD